MTKKNGRRGRRKSASRDFMKELRPGVASLESEISQREDQLNRYRSTIKRIDNLLDSKILMLEYKPVMENELAVIGSAAVQQQSQNNSHVLTEEMERLKKDKHRKEFEARQLSAELREARIALARVEIDEWRSLRSRSFLGRLFRQFGKIVSKLRADSKRARVPRRASVSFSGRKSYMTQLPDSYPSQYMFASFDNLDFFSWIARWQSTPRARSNPFD